MVLVIVVERVVSGESFTKMYELVSLASGTGGFGRFGFGERRSEDSWWLIFFGVIRFSFVLFVL